MNPGMVIEALDVIKYTAPRLITRLKHLSQIEKQLRFNGTKSAFGYRIVIAISNRSHALNKMPLIKTLTEIPTIILRPMIRVEDHHTVFLPQKCPLTTFPHSPMKPTTMAHYSEIPNWRSG
jgi:hypothetical protein